jgi:SH3-like domain-containing protein
MIETARRRTDGAVQQFHPLYQMPMRTQGRPALTQSLPFSLWFTLTIATASTPAIGEPIATGPVSGLQVPRFVSLKSDRVNVRAGPTKDHHVAWIFTRAGLPVEITAEFDNWRRVRDWEGSEGWVYHSLLSGRRTALVSANPRAKDGLLALRGGPREQEEVVARLQPGVAAAVKTCNGTWCRIAGEGFDGWIEQERLWGVYPNEKVE